MTAPQESTPIDDAFPSAYSSATIRADLYGAAARAESCLREGLIKPTDGGRWSRRRAAVQNLRVLAQVRADVEQMIADYVTVAREKEPGTYYDHGAPWEAIGAALGVSKQAAQKRYGGGAAS